MSIEIVEQIIKILAPIGAGIFALIKIWLHLKFKYKEKKTTETMIPKADRHNELPIVELKSIIQSVTADIANILYFMDDVILKTDAAKVVLLKCHNGGDVPNISGPLYSTVLYEAKRPGEERVADRWQKQPLDEQYILMLMRLFKEKKIVISTSELKECILKDIYVSSGVIFSKVVEVYVSQGKYFYLSVVYKKSPSELRPEEKDEIRNCVNKIRNTYIRNSKYV